MQPPNLMNKIVTLPYVKSNQSWLFSVVYKCLTFLMIIKLMFIRIVFYIIRQQQIIYISEETLYCTVLRCFIVNFILIFSPTSRNISTNPYLKLE